MQSKPLLAHPPVQLILEQLEVVRCLAGLSKGGFVGPSNFLLSMCLLSASTHGGGSSGQEKRDLVSSST